MMDLDFSGDLEHLSCPTLVLCGGKDRANRLAALADEAMLSSVIRVLYVQALPAGGHPLRGRAQNIE